MKQRKVSDKQKVQYLQSEVDRINELFKRREAKLALRNEERKKRLAREEMSPKSDSDDSIDVEVENQRDEY